MFISTKDIIQYLRFKMKNFGIALLLLSAMAASALARKDLIFLIHNFFSFSSSTNFEKSFFLAFSKLASDMEGGCHQALIKVMSV